MICIVTVNSIFREYGFKFIVIDTGANCHRSFFSLRFSYFYVFCFLPSLFLIHFLILCKFVRKKQNDSKLDFQHFGAKWIEPTRVLYDCVSFPVLNRCFNFYTTYLINNFINFLENSIINDFIESIALLVFTTTIRNTLGDRTRGPSRGKQTQVYYVCLKNTFGGRASFMFCLFFPYMFVLKIFKTFHGYHIH